jgi:hypothetical protein
MKRPVHNHVKPWLAVTGRLLMALPAILAAMADAGADSALRCGNRLVSIGAPPAEVAGKCGEPVHIEQWEEGGDGYVSQLFDYETERYLAPRLIKAPLRMERWTYDFGTNKFIRYLTFQNGRLIKIQTGHKGTR